MWYNLKTASFSFEDKIIYHNAEKLVRERLYYKGSYNISEDKVSILANQVVDNLKKSFGDLNRVRRNSETENLDEIVKKAVEEILP
jgi:chromosomal replication initiation ATPase DnaA